MPQKPAKPTTQFMAFRAAPEMARAMLRLTARDGMPLSEQMRRALEEWLPKRNVGYKKKERK